MNWIVYLLPALALPAAIFFLWRRRRAGNASPAHGLEACRLLLALLAGFQQHRGMSTAWLAGDRSFASRLDGKAGEIGALLQALRPLARHESDRPHPCLTVNELALFAHRWSSLRETLAGRSVDQSIAEHSQLVEQLLRWLAAFGEARVEPLLAGRDAHAAVRNYAARLPALTECLGQARAVGLGVATRGRCPAVARVRLMFLIARAETLLDQAVAGSPPCRHSERAGLAVRHMLQLVRQRLLGAGGVDIGAERYFADATLAVDAVFAWISESGRQLAAAAPAAGPGLRPVPAG